ncbi:MAG TPA: VRR-NUC domain-containing protein, partial [Myxococcota bacterium]|nr:VRR-NUC domain-containing protein [Myxococcota bacterium]
RRLGGWPPDPPLRAARARDVRLVGERTAQGPRFGGATVEPAVAGWLVEQGREVIVSEGQAWRTLLALLFVDVMFMPVDGQLPVPLLAGPLDWGTPAFAQRRAEAVDAVWASLEAGEGPARVLSGWERWQGVRLRGARWEVASASQLAALAAAPGLRAVLEPLLLGGSRAARGLPDLVVLPGPAVRLSGAFPSGLSERLTLVELKTENDALRDDQAAWHDRLARAGLDVELWRVQVIGA